MKLRPIFLLLSFGAAVACGAHDFSGDEDAGSDVAVVPPPIDASFGDTAAPDAGDGGCTNLQCNVDLACGDAGLGETTLTGTVYDPAGAVGLYGIFVYVPNATPDPIAPGNPTCSACQAPASGSPIVSTFTDAKGHFTLTRGPNDKWGVPTGDGIPLVIQAGKWRRQLVVPHVDSCGTVDLDAVFNSGTGTLQQQHQLRLPSKSSEGDMPLIAFTSGIDPAECFLLHVGIDPSEFVPPTSPTGHVHFYTGLDSEGKGGVASTIDGGDTPLETYQWWTDHANLEKYDLVFNACEGAPNSRVPKNGAVEDPYVAMDEYLKAGGRLFATHYYENWFTNPSTPDLKSAADWGGAQGDGGAGISETENVDQTFPKGAALADWLVNAGASTTPGVVTFTDTRDSIQGLEPQGCSVQNASCYSTSWIYEPTSGHPRYVSFNVPVGAPNSAQCGRAVLSNVHLSGTTNGATFPDECAKSDPDYANNERALEFLFFDLASCVQNDDAPPQPPN
ncbi:MAG TPA: hypothetical protein VGH28_29075 [Polyangiaceae bacterium]|jgi:hypothetical protein